MYFVQINPETWLLACTQYLLSGQVPTTMYAEQISPVLNEISNIAWYN